MSRGEPSFSVALALSLGPLAVVGALAGIQVRDDPDAVVATTLFIVAIVDLLGLVRYVVYGAEHRERTRLRDIYQSRFDNAQLDAEREEARKRLHEQETRDVEFDSAWMLLPQLAVSGFGVALAIAALTGG